MAKKTVNIGTSVNKGNGDPLRTAFSKINDNFDELYAQTGDDVQIPAQATHTGKFLTTNGTTLSWASGDGDKLVKGVHTVSLGTDGMLTLPNGLALPGGAGIFGDATGGYQITDSANSSYVTFDAGGLQLDTYDGSNIRLRTTPVGTADYKDWVFNSNGNLSFPDGSNQITAYTGSAQNIASENAVNIDVNLTDSTLRRWRFGEDGDLTLPTGSSIADTVGNAVIGSNSGTVSITNLEVMNFTQLAPSNYLWITNQYYSGSLLTSTFGSLTGTATVATTRVVTGVTQLSTSGLGSGAQFQVTVYYDGNSVTYTAVGIDYNNGNAQYGTGYAVGDTVTIAGASLGGTTPTNNLTFTIGNLVKNNYPAGLEGGIIYDYSNKHFLAYNGSTWTQLDNPLTPSGTKASNAYGVAGQTSFDSNYFYICIATNTWRRVALGSSY